MAETVSLERVFDRIGCGNEPTLAVKTGGWRFRTPYHEPKLSPCSDACPAGSAVPAWLEAFGGGRLEEAWDIISRENPFPSITGHVCFRFCEERCNRGELDEAVRPYRVEQAIGEWRRTGYRPAPPPAVPARGSVAVVGAGPAGLSCAFYLAREGCRVSVYEKEAVAGGLLATGIPGYRFPRTVLEAELEQLRRDGVVFRLNCTVGKDVSLDELHRSHDAVFLATGASRPGRISIPGLEEGAGDSTALEFLRRINLEGSAPARGPVVVVGGGNAAIDAARSAMRLPGVAAVTVVYRRGREVMPADPREVAAAQEEGVRFFFYRVPVELRGATGGGRELILARARQSSRGEEVSLDREPEAAAIPCGTLIQAVGQEADWSIFGTLESGRFFYAGGDLVTGPSTVTAAINAGRNAAGAIAARLRGKTPPHAAGRNGGAVTLAGLHLSALALVPLRPFREGPAGEADRCLGCGTCNGCGICQLFCPDMAVEPDGRRYRFNLDYCKGCGVCARECPAQALAMGGEDYAG